MEQTTQNKDKEALESLQISKIIPPILIGLGVVILLMIYQLDTEQFKLIPVTLHTFIWLGLAGFLYFLRHMFYSWRLYVMTTGDFTWWKSVELITIWEFASAVSPTNIGGSAVAIFLLAQEKISSARTVSIVLYSMVLDTIIFVLFLPLLYLFLGPLIVRPGLENGAEMNGYVLTFWVVLGIMFTYGSFFAYGLFLKPVHFKRILLWISKIRILKRFQQELRKTAIDVVNTSRDISNQSISFHLKCMAGTTGAWAFRFLALNCIIIALVPSVSMGFTDQILIFSRAMSMHAITTFSPTPGGAGVAELLFGGFFSDYIYLGISSVIALVWRLITYYPYLLSGAIVIPVWIREVVIRRKREKLANKN